MDVKNVDDVTYMYVILIGASQSRDMPQHTKYTKLPRHAKKKRTRHQHLLHPWRVVPNSYQNNWITFDNKV